MENVSAGVVGSVPLVFYSTMRDPVDMEVLFDCQNNITNKSNASACPPSGMKVVAVPVTMFLAGMFGNVLALVILYWTRKDTRKTVFYTFVGSLVCTDLLSTLTTSPVAILVYANGLKWIGGKALCNYHAFAMISFGMICPFTVCFMAIERLLALRFTYFHSVHLTPLKVRISLGLMWFFVFAFATLPFLGFGLYEHQFPGSWCFLKFHVDPDNPQWRFSLDAVYSYLYACINLIVLLITVICNMSVIIVLLKMRRRRRFLLNMPALESGSACLSRRPREAEIQMVWLLCGMTLIFCTCWAPLMMRIIVCISTMTNNSATDMIVVRGAAVNQILNPWVYIIMRRSIFNGFIKCARKVFCLQTNYDIVETHRPVYNPRAHPRLIKHVGVLAVPRAAIDDENREMNGSPISDVGVEAMNDISAEDKKCLQIGSTVSAEAQKSVIDQECSQNLHERQNESDLEDDVFLDSSNVPNSPDFFRIGMTKLQWAKNSFRKSLKSCQSLPIVARKRSGSSSSRCQRDALSLSDRHFTEKTTQETDIDSR